MRTYFLLQTGITIKVIIKLKPLVSQSQEDFFVELNAGISLKLAVYGINKTKFSPVILMAPGGCGRVTLKKRGLIKLFKFPYIYIHQL